MSTYYYVGGEINAISIINPQPVQAPVVDSTQYSSSDRRGSVQVQATGLLQYGGYNYIDPATGLFLTSANGLRTFWSTFSYVVQSDNNGVPDETMTDWLDASGTPWFRLSQLTDNSYNYQMQYWDGSAWQATTIPPVTTGYGALGRWDVSFTLTSSGSIQLFCQNVLIGTFNHDFSGSNPIVACRHWTTPYTCTFFNMIVSDTSTREHNILFRGATGNGPEQQWTGDYNNIDEFPESTSDIIYSGTAAQASTFTHAPFSSLAPSNIVKAVAVGALVRRDSAGGPQNVDLRLTISGTDYDKPVQQPDISYLGRIAIWSIDPSTGLAWDGVTNANGPFGPVSVA